MKDVINIDLLQFMIDTNYDLVKIKERFPLVMLNEKDETGKTPLIRAVIKGDVKAVQLLVQLDANVELTDKQGKKATYYAAVHGYPKILAVLLKSGCGG